MKTTSFCLREGQVQMIEDIARESVGREDMPDLSKSEVIRRLLDAALEEDPEVADLVTESTRVKLREQRYMEDEGDLRNKRSGFETQVKRHFKRRFENGFRPDQLEEFAVNMRQKARIYWPEDFGGDYSERRAEALAYVDALLEEAKQAADASDYDPLDPSEVFDGYSGVEKGRDREDMDRLVSVAESLLDQRLADGQRVLPPKAVKLLKEREDVSEEVAQEAVDRATDDDGGGR